MERLLWGPALHSGDGSDDKTKQILEHIKKTNINRLTYNKSQKITHVKRTKKTPAFVCTCFTAALSLASDRYHFV